jgi:hypothetical protein
MVMRIIGRVESRGDVPAVAHKIAGVWACVGRCVWVCGCVSGRVRALGGCEWVVTCVYVCVSVCVCGGGGKHRRTWSRAHCTSDRGAHLNFARCLSKALRAHTRSKPSRRTRVKFAVGVCKRLRGVTRAIRVSKRRKNNGFDRAARHVAPKRKPRSRAGVIPTCRVAARVRRMGDSQRIADIAYVRLGQSKPRQFSSC